LVSGAKPNPEKFHLADVPIWWAQQRIDNTISVADLMQFLKALNGLMWPINLLLIDIYSSPAYLSMARIACQNLDCDRVFERQCAAKIAVIFYS
jgi:hypothetical protein